MAYILRLLVFKEGKHPGILIYATVNSSGIDVNIHPTKREVKFADENGICDILFKALRNVVVSHTYPEIKITYPSSLNKEESAKQETEGSSANSTSKIQQPVIYVKEPKPKYK
jgi:DNA mismatch repair protein MutL